MTAGWKEFAEEKRNAVNSLIPTAWRIPNPPSIEDQRDVTKYIEQFLDPQELEITETDAVGIAMKTISGEWKAIDVTKAFCHRAALAHQLTNCLLEIFFESAIQQAKSLDDYYGKEGRPLGPLHGVPVSLKDQFHVKGVETTMGYVGWIGTFEGTKGTGKEKVFESELVVELQTLGAVTFCKTSVPHTLMCGESDNNIMGYVWNPKNRNLSAGGSSGGEGALIGLKGSPLGFGTDIGGSIRIPAAFNGLWGLRPSAGRIPYEGMANSMDGQSSMLSVVGPIATSCRSLQYVVKSILSQQPWLFDPLVVEMPWREQQEQDVAKILNQVGSTGGKLAFGLINTNTVVKPHPPILRALQMVSSALEKAGHTILQWKPPPSEVLNMVEDIWGFDGGADVHKAFELSGEPMIENIQAFYGGGLKAEKTASHIAAINVAKRKAQKAYMDYWNNSKKQTGTGRPVDAIICPVAQFAAALPQSFTYYGYGSWVNFFDYTSVVIPVTTVDKNIDLVDASYQPQEKSQDETIHKLYDPEVYDGAHVALQLVGRRFQEEKTLAIADYVGKLLSSTS